MNIKTRKKIWVIIVLNQTSGHKMLAGFLDFLAGKHDWDLEIDTHPGKISPARVRELVRKGLDGVVLTMPLRPETQAALAATDVPIVCVGVRGDALATRTAPTRFVWADDAAIGNAAAEHLLACGTFASYAFLGLKNENWSRARANGFAAVLSRRGKKPERRTFAAFPPTAEEAADLRRFLHDIPKPAALFAAYDELSLAALKAAQAMKIKTPAELAVAGVDNVEQIVEPHGLTSIRLAPAAFGFRAAATLHRLLSGKKVSDEPITIDSLEIVRRKSTRTDPDRLSLIADIENYIDAHSCEATCTAETIAAHLGLSRSTVEHRYREAKKRSLHHAVLNARLREAKKKIASAKKTPLAEIAAACGFANAAHLSRLYKSRFGVSPRKP